MKDTRIKCAVCGLIYQPKKTPLPACKSEDGPKGPTGFHLNELKFMKCVLSILKGKAK